MFVAFLIGVVCFNIHANRINSMFGLSEGSLFAVIGIKYIIEAFLPASSSFTLLDTLHGLTLVFIFAVITSTNYSPKLVIANKLKEANRFDRTAEGVLLVLCVYVFKFLFYFKSRYGLIAYSKK